MVDIIKGLAQGEALDLLQSANFDIEVTGSDDHRDISGSKLVIISAGVARSPGMDNRLELLDKNTQTVHSISEQILEFAPKSIVIVVTNPLDIMTYLTLKTTGFEGNRVLGMGSSLDSSRFSFFLSRELNVSAKSVQALVIGEHGKTMVPLVSHSSVNNMPIKERLSETKIKKVIERVNKAGAEIIGLKGSSFYAPSVAVASMAESIIKDKKTILSAAVCLQGEYGLNDVCIGVPVKLGKNGVEEIIELELEPEEKEQLNESANVIKEKISSLK